MKVYIVMGRTGEYSDRDEWPVVAFLFEDEAKKRVLLATNRAKEWEVLRKDSYEDPPANWNEYDCDMKMDYTGTDYYYFEVEVIS